jgi:hypothetical protein
MTIAQRLCRRSLAVGIRARTLGGFAFDRTDRFFQRQPLARDFGFLKRRIDAAQLIDQRGTRAVVQRTAIFARVLVETRDRTGNKGVIVRHPGLI